MSNSKVSVIIPTYNRASKICKAIDSVLLQDYKNFEIIVVDDGSKDKTRQILLSKYGNKLKYFKILHNGVSGARNFGIKKADGEYIALLDSDDYWLPNKLSYQMEFLLENPDIKICQTEEIWLRDGVRVNPMKKHKKPSGLIFDKILSMCLVSPSASIIHKDIFDKIGLFDESLPVCEDYDFWIRASLYYEIVLLPKPMITKTGGHADQLSHKYFAIDRFRVKSLEKIYHLLPINDSRRDLIKNELNCKLTILANGAKKRGKMRVFHEYNKKQELIRNL